MNNFTRIDSFTKEEQKGLAAMGVATSYIIQKIRAGDQFGYQFTNVNNDNRRVIYNQEFKKLAHLSMEKDSTLAPITFGPLDHSSPIFCTEGETDAISLSNFTANILCFPGANGTNLKKLGTNFTDKFNGTETFAIVFDNDEAGRSGAQALKSQLLEVLPDAHVKVVDISTIGHSINDIREGIMGDVFTYEDLEVLVKETPAEGKQSQLLNLIAETDSDKPKLPIAYNSERGILTYSISMQNSEDNILLISSDQDGVKKITDSVNPTSLEVFETESKKDLPLVKGLKAETIKKFWGKNQAPKQIYNELMSYFHKQIFFHEFDYLHVHTSFAFMTYIYPIFPTIGYLHINGNKHCGKSQLSKIHADIDFNAQLSTSSTMAAIRRIIHHDRGTIILDDWEKAYSSDNQEQLISMLNSGYNTNSKSMLVDKESMKPLVLFTGGPKIFNSINKIDPVLASRSIIIKMRPAPSDFKRRETPSPDDLKDLRSRLILWALENHGLVRDIFLSSGQSISREEELYKPLESIVISIFGEDSPELNSIRRIKSKHAELQVERLGHNEIVLDEIYQLWSIAKPLHEFECSNAEIFSSLQSRDDLPSNFHRNKIKEAIATYHMCLRSGRKPNANGLKPTIYTINVPTLLSSWKALKIADVDGSKDFN